MDNSWVVNLEPCPFCGNNDLYPESMSSVRYIRCRQCSASGGHSFDYEGLLWSWETTSDRWNKRLFKQEGEVIGG